MSSEAALTSQTSSVASVCTLADLWAPTLHISEVYDLTGTIGLAFFWWGADNPPSSLVQIILETSTGFWYSDFYDGPARWRYVFIPWGSFIWVSSPQRLLEPHYHGFEEPDKSQVTGFIWTVHTAGTRRLDYVHAPRQLLGPIGVFVARHSQSHDVPAAFVIRHSAVSDLLVNIILRHSTSRDLSGGFRISRQGIGDLLAAFDIAP